MKKIFLMAVMSLVVLACGKEENKETPKEETHPIEGSWYSESYTETVQGVPKTYETDECQRKGSITFSAGKVKYVECEYSESDASKCECEEYDHLQETYTIDGNKLIRKGVEKNGDKEYPYTFEQTFSISGNTLTITNDDGRTHTIYKKR